MAKVSPVLARGRKSASKKCEGCGTDMFGAPSSIARRRFCTWDCRCRHMPPPRTSSRVEWVCAHCGEVEMRLPSDTLNKFCSLTCRNEAAVGMRRKRVQCVCPCGVEFETQPSRVALGRGLHCSRECANAFRAVNFRPSRIATAAIEAFLAQTPVLAVAEHRVGRFSVDLALPLHNLAVELDGCYWHSLPAMQDRDRRKDEALRSAGWRVARIVINKSDTPEMLAAQILAAVKRHTGGEHGSQAA